MKYNIGENLKVKGSKKIVEIIDYEIFDNIILYYTSDNNAYPENKLEKNASLLSLILSDKPHFFTEEEKENSLLFNPIDDE